MVIMLKLSVLNLHVSPYIFAQSFVHETTMLLFNKIPLLSYIFSRFYGSGSHIHIKILMVAHIWGGLQSSS